MNSRHSTSAGDERTTRHAKTRWAVAPLLAALVLGAGLALVTGCEEEESRFEEAVEEVEDEAGDLRENIEDEIDDHT